MNLNDRMTKMEVKLSYMEKLLYLIILVTGGQLGIEYIPVVSAMLP